jgi:hypothetical protein
VPHCINLDNAATCTDVLVGADGFADRGIAGPVIRGGAVIDCCDPLQKLDMAGFLP